MLDGPLGLGGPLSDAGPLTYQSIYCSLPCMNDYSHHLLPAGIWGVLGPFGPTGPLGPLGPLGPVGAHGYLANQNGQYVDVDGNVHRTIDAPYNETYNRTFELYEFYTQPFAASFKDQDTSFMVEGTYDSSHPERSTYPFTSKQEQVVIITVVPINQLNSYAFSATGGSFNVTNSLSALSYISWAQLRAKQGEQFTVKVWLNAAFGLVYGYRLYVVGSTSEFVNTDVTGPQRIFV
ncbi:hypothetical protein Pelo_8981 [Pelomyxa schiedti]|nr:hypothetical protein Pelo_8981 [Pelomyxa schiedti]